MTKDTRNFRQLRSVACRDTLFLETIQLQKQKVSIQGNMRIGPVLVVTTSFRHFFKYGIEIRILSVNQNNSQSWVRMSHPTTKIVVDSIQDNTEILVHKKGK